MRAQPEARFISNQEVYLQMCAEIRKSELRNRRRRRAHTKRLKERIQKSTDAVEKTRLINKLGRVNPYLDLSSIK